MALDTFNPYLFVSAGEQSNKFLTPTITNGIAQFQAQRAQGLSGLTVRIDPIQEGTGDPSPTNIRPISGRTGLTVTAAGKNIMPVYPVVRSADPSITTDGDTYTINGTAAGYTQSVANESFTLAAGDYYFKAFTISGTGGALAQLRSTDGITIYAAITNSGGAAFHLTEDTEVKFRITVGKGTISNLKFKCMISQGTTAPAAYTPYVSPTTYPISWQTEAGTVYGGILDVVSGVLMVDWDYIASYAGETLPGEWISDRDVYAEGTTPTTGAEVAYKLAEPVVYQLDPEQVTTLPGFNQIYSDAGPVIDIKF